MRQRRAFLDKIGQEGVKNEVQEEETRTASPKPKPKPKTRFRRARTVHPPCDTIALAALPLEPRENIILTVAQFRCAFGRSLALGLSLTQIVVPQAGEGAQRPAASPSPALQRRAEVSRWRGADTIDPSGQCA